MAVLTWLASSNLRCDQQVSWEYQLILARDLEYITKDAHTLLEGELVEVKRILNALIRKIRSGAGTKNSHPYAAINS
jgi:hypothetical protein